jgi:hypothetical protein
MPLFRVLLLGENFPGAILGQEESVGFYTTRFVEAIAKEHAEAEALAVLQADPALTLRRDQRTKSATVKIEELVEVPTSTERKPNAGFTFFTMGT